LAQSGHSDFGSECPLSGLKRTSKFESVTSAFDPKRTSGLNQIAVISDAQRRSMRLRGQFSANKVPVAPDYFVLGLYVLETQSEYAWCLKI
jgi:hypothetical protein